MEKPNKKLIVGASLAGIFILSAIVAYFTNSPKIPSNTDSSSTLTKQKTYEIPTAGNFSFGAEKPKITIIEFADFNCSHCKNSYPTIRQLGYKYKDKVKIIFKDYPVLENSSMDLALAARCAGEQNQNLFWAMHDKFYADQGQFSLADLPDMAKEIGVNTTAFNACLKEKKYEDQINQDFFWGQQAGIQGTPTFFVNGYLLPGGSLPPEAWEKTIQFFLANNKTNEQK